jgi:FkbM family methyltransferase
MAILKYQLRAQRILGRIFASVLKYDLFTLSWIDSSVEILKLGGGAGSWHVPSNVLSSESICYCFGCGEDISFDLALIAHYGCHVYAYDPTERAIQYVKSTTSGVKEYHFSDIGIWNEDTTLKFYSPSDARNVSHSALNLQQTNTYFEAPVKRLSSLMAANGHDHIDLLKIDVEGAEYKVVQSIVEDEIPIGVLCMEFDECFGPQDFGYMRRIVSTARSLKSLGFRISHSTGNGNLTFVHASVS